MTPSSNIYWADLHNHNEIGYGQGSLDRSYRLARNALDVFAFSVHGYWPDPPDNDPKLVEYHTAAFDAISRAFPSVIAAANQYNKPGEFAAFIAYEWHSTAWGDYVVIFPGDTGELLRAQDLAELKRFVRQRGAIMIPHHVGYRRGWRGLDWAAFDPKVSPLVEIYSEHGSSFEPDGPDPMLQHSMGGVTASQTVIAQLRRGSHFGFTAGTDTHFGYPGSYREGITGIYANALTRTDIFHALQSRHTFAASGDRVELRVDADGALPGDIRPASAPRRFKFSVDPLAPLDYVELLKNGRRIQVWPTDPDPRSAPGGGSLLVRLDWGWGRMDVPDETIWDIVVDLRDGEIIRAIPCFSGGAAAVNAVNLLHRIGPATIRIESFTSRRNPFPVCGAVLEIQGHERSRIECTVQASAEGRAGTCEVSASVRELLSDDVWQMPFPRFSSPRIRVGRAYSRRALQFHAEFLDRAPGTRDTYVFKARQTNGHTAWTSPYLFADDDADPGDG